MVIVMLRKKKKERKNIYPTHPLTDNDSKVHLSAPVTYVILYIHYPSIKNIFK